MRQTSESSLASTVSSASYNCDERPVSANRVDTPDSADVMDFLDEAMSDSDLSPPQPSPRKPAEPVRRTSQRQLNSRLTSPRGIVSIDSYRCAPLLLYVLDYCTAM